jgi:type IV secretion system protein VirB10
MSDATQSAPDNVGPDGEDHRFQAERKRRTSKTAILVVVAFVLTMAAVGAGVMLAKSYIRDYQQQREEKRREKERLAKVEQQRAKKVFAPPGSLPPAPAASMPQDEVPPVTGATLPVNFGSSRAQPIEVKDTATRPQSGVSHLGGQRSGPPAPPPPPPATMMLTGDQPVRGSAGGTAPTGQRTPDASAAQPESAAAAYQAKMDQLLSSATGAQGRGAGPGANPNASAPAAAGPAIIPRGVGRSTVQDYAKVNAARTAITSTPQATAAMLGDRSLLLARGAFIPCTLETQLFSNVPGECRCVLPEDIYSDDGSTLLIEKGSTVTGTYGNTLKAGDSRIAVVWQRIKTVKGAVVDVESPAADGVGTMGVDGYVDNHWGKRIGAALLLSIIDDAVSIEVAKQSDGGATRSTPTSTVDTTKSMSEQVLSSTINIPPTISKSRSARLMISVRRDLWFHDVYSIVKR